MPLRRSPDPVLEFYGKLDAFDKLKADAGYGMVVLLLITSGLAHLPPIKVVTILSGATNVNLGLFVITAIVARGARFFLLAALLRNMASRSATSSRSASAISPLPRSSPDPLYLIAPAFPAVRLICTAPDAQECQDMNALAQAAVRPARSFLQRHGGNGRHGARLSVYRRLYSLHALLHGARALLLRDPGRHRRSACRASRHPAWIAKSLLGIVLMPDDRGAGIGTYHAGAEWGFWDGPSTCSTPVNAVTKNAGNLLSDLNSVHGPSCTEAALARSRPLLCRLERHCKPDPRRLRRHRHPPQGCLNVMPERPGNGILISGN